MKHTNSNIAYVANSTRNVISICMFGAFILLSACKKEVANEKGLNRSIAPKAKLSSGNTASLLQNVQYKFGRVINNTIQLSYDSNRHVGGMNFIFADGSVRTMPTTMHAEEFVQVVYKYDKSSTKIVEACASGRYFMHYQYDHFGNLVRSDYEDKNDPGNNYYILYTSTPGNNLQDKYSPAGNFLERTIYSHNPDGSFKAIEKYDPYAGMRLKGSIVFHNRYTAEQLDNWKETVAVFPEPVLPFYMMMLLSEKVEMHLEPGYCCDDVIVDGRIITVVSRELWGERKKVTIDFIKTDKGAINTTPMPIESLSLNYTKVEW